MYNIGARCYAVGSRDRYGIGAALQRARARTVPTKTTFCEACELCGGVCALDPDGKQLCMGDRRDATAMMRCVRYNTGEDSGGGPRPPRGVARVRALGRAGGRGRLRVGAAFQRRRMTMRLPSRPRAACKNDDDCPRGQSCCFPGPGAQCCEDCGDPLCGLPVTGRRLPRAGCTDEELTRGCMWRSDLKRCQCPEPQFR
jgi:hypothetical protein